LFGTGATFEIDQVLEVQIQRLFDDLEIDEYQHQDNSSCIFSYILDD